MHIEITGEMERLIKAALAAGQFASAEEFIAAMALAYRSTEAKRQLQLLRTHVDTGTLANEQGVQPLKDLRDLKGSFWEESKSVDAFIDDIRTLREHGMPRTH